MSSRTDGHRSHLITSSGDDLNIDSSFIGLAQLGSANASQWLINILLRKSFSSGIVRPVRLWRVGLEDTWKFAVPLERFGSSVNDSLFRQSPNIPSFFPAHSMPDLKQASHGRRQLKVVLVADGFFGRRPKNSTVLRHGQPHRRMTATEFKRRSRDRTLQILTVNDLTFLWITTRRQDLGPSVNDVVN